MPTSASGGCVAFAQDTAVPSVESVTLVTTAVTGVRLSRACRSVLNAQGRLSEFFLISGKARGFFEHFRAPP
jgi:hypothetical protein